MTSQHKPIHIHFRFSMNVCFIVQFLLYEPSSVSTWSSSTYFKCYSSSCFSTPKFSYITPVLHYKVLYLSPMILNNLEDLHIYIAFFTSNHTTSNIVTLQRPTVRSHLTRSSNIVTLQRPPVRSRLKLTNISFTHHSPGCTLEQGIIYPPP